MRTLVAFFCLAALAGSALADKRDDPGVSSYLKEVTSVTVDGVTYRAVVAQAQSWVQLRTPTEWDEGWSGFLSSKVWLQTLVDGRWQTRELVFPWEETGGYRPHGYGVSDLRWDGGVLRVSLIWDNSPDGTDLTNYEAACTLVPGPDTRPECRVVRDPDRVPAMCRHLVADAQLQERCVAVVGQTERDIANDVGDCVRQFTSDTDRLACFERAWAAGPP